MWCQDPDHALFSYSNCGVTVEDEFEAKMPLEVIKGTVKNQGHLHFY